MKKIIFFVIILFLASALCSAEDTHLYATWDTLELDTCASAWLIKNFTDKDAEFVFYPKGAMIEGEAAFDTPDAEFRRKGNLSTFETIIKKYKIVDKKVIAIAKMIHEIEINFWSGSLTPEMKNLNEEISAIIKEAEVPSEAFEKSFDVFDRLYKN